MSWIISIILFIILLILGLSKYKTNKILKELLEERDNNFTKYYNQHIKEIEDAEKERRERLEKEFKEKENNIKHSLELLRKDLENKQNQLKLEEEKLQDKIKLGERIINSELSKYRTEKIFSIDAELADQKKAADSDYNNYKIEHSKKIEQLNSEIVQLNGEIDEIKIQLEDFRNRRATTNEAIMREKEIKEKEDFYRILLSKDDLDDMNMLESIAPKMRNRTVIPKLIWEAILRRPVAEMIKRVTGGKDICGIYKVTYVKTGEAYIGQSSGIKIRWQNHCKTAIGLEAAASSTFHTRLASDGIENYTWEILEETSKDKLREREKYWINFYETNKIGLNQREG